MLMLEGSISNVPVVLREINMGQDGRNAKEHFVCFVSRGILYGCVSHKVITVHWDIAYA